MDKQNDVDKSPTPTTEIEAARRAFFARAPKHLQREEPVNTAPPMTQAQHRVSPATTAASGASDIAGRHAGGGKAVIDVLTDVQKWRAYRSWVEMDVNELRTIAEPGQREACVKLIADNARDPAYGDALREADNSLARVVDDILEARAGSAEVQPKSADAPSTPEPEGKTPGASAVPAAPVVASAAPVAADDDRLSLHQRPVANDARHASAAVISDEIAARVAARRSRESDRVRRAIVAAASAAPVRVVQQSHDHGSNTITRAVNRKQDDRAQQVRAPNEREDACVLAYGYEIPEAIARRYVVKDGRYWQFDGVDRRPELTREPHFQDHGARLSTPSDDPGTIADMVAIVQAKGWKEVSVNGSEIFRRAAWIEANLAGIQVSGFEPTERDTAMLEAARREHDALKISAGRPVATPVAATAAQGGQEIPAAAAQAPTPVPASDDARPTVPLGDLRRQVEEVIADLPDNVRCEVMDRFAQRIDAGLKVQQLHERSGTSRAELGKALDAQIAAVDRARVVRNPPPVRRTDHSREPGRGSRHDGPELGH